MAIIYHTQSNDSRCGRSIGQEENTSYLRSIVQYERPPDPRGVFVSTRSLFAESRSPPTSASSVASTSSSSPPSSSSRPISWRSTGYIDHNRSAPLIVSDPDKDEPIGSNDAAAEKLERAMERARKLPNMWHYSSNHIMVNQERTKRTIAPVIRMRELDEMARQHAEAMSISSNRLDHIDPDALQQALRGHQQRRLGSNVAKGWSLREMHKDMMKELANRNNILDPRFTHMGMATARAADGKLYLCQIFRG